MLKKNAEFYLGHIDRVLKNLHDVKEYGADFNKLDLLNLIESLSECSPKIQDELVDKLNTILNILNEYYFIKAEPLIDDGDFDRLEKLIQPTILFDAKQDKSVPLLQGVEKIDAMEDIPLLKDEEKQAKHSIEMLSLDKFLEPKDVEDFVKRLNRYLNKNQDYIYSVEPKIDGNSISLIYENGILTKALSRGDGKVGEVLTLAIFEIPSIPKILKIDDVYAKDLYIPKILEVRGEIFMGNKDFLALNEMQKNLGEKEFANPRNATAGTLRNLDAKIIKARKLQFLPWGFGRVDDNFLSNSMYKNLQQLEKLGFSINPYNKLCNNINEAISHYEYLGQIRQSLNYDIDGVVFKVDDVSLTQRLGNTEKAPRWAGAYKFPPYLAKTKLLSITLQVGRSGVITPVAELQPINVGGVLISRATLHNFDYIVNKDIRINDIVAIKRAGDVIPAVVEVDLSKRDTQNIYELPKFCPSCNSTLIRDNVAMKCSFDMYGCSDIFLRTLEHMVSKSALDIAGLASRQLEFFIKEGLISLPHHIFELKNHSEKILCFEGFQQKSLNNLIQSIDNAKNTSFDRLIYALGINQIGEKMAKVLATNFKNMNALIQAILNDDNLEIQGIGESIWQDLKAYFHNSKNISMIDNLLKYLNVADFVQETIESKLTNKKILFSGTLKMARKEAQNLAQKHGAIILSAVSKNLDYLICGEDAGSKLTKAKELNITIISEEDFLNLISNM